MAERRNKIFEKYGLFDADACELEQSLNNMSLTVQSYAVPLTVSTRGVGFAATIEYSRMTTTWNFQAIVEICTIFHEEVRQILASVSQVPVATSTILGAIGKIEGSTVWHSYLPDVEMDDPISCALFLSPSNIRSVLDHINADATPIAFRERFRQMCPVPGIHWSVDHRVQNADEVWPLNYSSDTLSVTFTKNSQMPRHLISDAHEWINEIPSVPIYFLAKPLPRERAWKN
ncbi:hypothetical protein KPH14_000889 [Odynerus spinipes]|uniref:Uncharacterized protein n=1 Tax=Odynerus spinipes TaxID=1348599 RepID=A0AAD9VJ06_9HYME|nr:hypothetical protein KPH14_000889 [Odynerus spinipes]